MSGKQSGDGGQSQAQPGREGGRGVAQVGVAARLGHLVDGGVGVGGEVHLRRLVALALLQTALHLDRHAGCRATADTHIHTITRQSELQSLWFIVLETVGGGVQEVHAKFAEVTSFFKFWLFPGFCSKPTVPND